MNNTSNIDPILGFDPWFLRPPKEAQEIKHSDYYIKHNEKKKGNRKVYQKVQYDEFEKQHIEILQQEMQKQQIQVPADWKTSDYLKMCYCGRFDLKKDIKAAKDHIEWRNNQNVHSLDDKSRALLQNGMIYLLGRDPQFRPIVYLDCTKINLKKDGEETILKAICVFLDMIKKYMFLDYFIENWIMVIDTGSLGISSLPINGLKLIIGSMSTNYCATMDKMFLLNPSFMLNTSWNIIKGFIDPESVEKIQFLKPKEFKEMQKKIPIKYLQKKYQGQHDDLTTFCEEERHKLLKNQQVKAKEKETENASPPKKNIAKDEQGKPGIPNQLNESSKIKDENGKNNMNSKEIGVASVGITTNVNGSKQGSQAIQNNGIKPKIIVITVQDDQIDSRYANAGYDEHLERKLQDEAEKQKVIIMEQQKAAAKEETQSGSQIMNNKNKIGLNGQFNASPSSTQQNGNSTYNTNTNNNINITSTDYSEMNHQSQHVNHKNKTYHSAVPDIIDSKQEESTDNNPNKNLNDDEIDPIYFDPNLQNNPLISFEGNEPVQNAQCCQNCTIF